MNKQDIAKSYADRQCKVLMILSWSLASIPKQSLTNDTFALLPNIQSHAYLQRAKSCGYDYSNITNSYNLLNTQHVKLFDDYITESFIFYDDHTCVISTYIDKIIGHESQSIVVNKGSELYENKIKIFNKMWHNSSFL